MNRYELVGKDMEGHDLWRVKVKGIGKVVPVLF